MCSRWSAGSETTTDQQLEEAWVAYRSPEWVSASTAGPVHLRTLSTWVWVNRRPRAGRNHHGVVENAGLELPHCIWMSHRGLKAGLKPLCAFCHLPLDLPAPSALLAHGTTVVLASSLSQESSLHHAVLLLLLPLHNNLSAPKSFKSPVSAFFSSPFASPRLSHFSSAGTSLPHFLLPPNHLDITCRLILQCIPWIIPFLCSKTFQGSPRPVQQSQGLGILSFKSPHTPAAFQLQT